MKADKTWVSQCSPNVEKCTQCKKHIPVLALYWALVSSLDGDDKTYKKVCYDCVRDAEENRV